MAEEPRPQGWWQTLPGILTATASVIAAVTGLIVALYQAGVLGKAASTKEGVSPKMAVMPNTAVTPNTGAIPNAGAIPHAGAIPNAGAAPLAKYDTTPYAVTLPAGDEVTMGSAVYKVLSAQVDRPSMEKLSLKFSIRMTNNRGYGDNFWDNSFRLLIAGVPRAPVGDLNEVVEGNSAKDGEVLFMLPDAVGGRVELQIIHEEEKAKIPLALMK